MDRRTFIGTAGCAALATASVPLLMLRDVAPKEGAKILFGGDTCHGESYARGGEQILQERGYGYSLEALTPLIRRADYALVNLETPVANPVAERAQDKDYVHWSDPQSLAALAASGIDAVGLANNHTLDYGRLGLEQTFASLRQSGISFFGAGANLNRAAAPLMLRLPSPSGMVNAAVFGMFEYRKTYDEKYGFYATPDLAGANALSVYRFAAQAARLRKAIPGIYIVAFPHWGSNYAWRTGEQRRTGRALIDAGADIVIGHHGHTMQEIERYQGKWILYGIGNFMFNAPGRFDNFPNVEPIGLAVELNVTSAGRADARLYPINSDNRKTNYRPNFANRDQSTTAFASLLRKSGIEWRKSSITVASDEIGTYLELRSNA